ncbi:P-loop containing nucleoside triphosphate hydrolase protein [Mycena latifolia]|nr:P-loop containing nucleoside triphosphate hydrolase protein [Mycena latifolia]
MGRRLGVSPTGPRPIALPGQSSKVSLGNSWYGFLCDLEHLPHLRALLGKWNESRPASEGFSSEVPPAEDASKEVIVAFRTRAPLPNEAAKFHADPDAKDAPGNAESAQFCAGITAISADPGVFVAHVPGMKARSHILCVPQWSGPTLVHKSYEADLGFGPDIDNEEVYQRTVVAHDILSLALSGGVACVLAYGQTGSGKTFTMESLEHRVARDLGVGRTRMGSLKINATFLELVGKRAADLLETSETLDAQGNPAGNVQPRFISSPVRSSAELEELIKRALSHRRTAATQRNEASSRSHAVLSESSPRGPGRTTDRAVRGLQGHDKQRMNEVRENNRGLMNLKECVRAKAQMASEDGFHIPWRANKLTMLLKASPPWPVAPPSTKPTAFPAPLRRRIVPAVAGAHHCTCLAPHSRQRTFQRRCRPLGSTNTLSYAAPFKTVPPKPRGPAPYDADDPRTWDHAQTTAWFAAQFAGHTSAPAINLSAVCPPGMTAAHLGRLYTSEFVARCLAARTPPSSDADAGLQTLTSAALDVIGTLFYMLVVAKNRTRRAVMESRTRETNTWLQSPEAAMQRAAKMQAERLAAAKGTSRS